VAVVKASQVGSVSLVVLIPKKIHNRLGIQAGTEFYVKIDEEKDRIIYEKKS